MPSPRWLPLLPILFLFSACDQRSLQQTADQIRQQSDREDRMYKAQALQQIEHTYWTLRDHAWFGKLQDGTIVRLDAPHITLAPLPSMAFYSGWHLQMTITSDQWRTYPATSTAQPFQTTYAITRHGATNWNIRVSDGYITSPLHREDAPRLDEDGGGSGAGPEL
jgi:hypothetical protein